jgi:hypothetical protein
MYQRELAHSIRLAKQRNVEKLDLLLFQFAKAGKSSRPISARDETRKVWNESYPERELKRIANSFGISFD